MADSVYPMERAMRGAASNKHPNDADIERWRRQAAWDTFVTYHDNAMWAREDAERKKAENAYLPPEAVAYMLGEIERRKGRAALRDALEAQDAKQPPENVPAEAAGNGNDGAADLGGPASNSKTDS